MLGMNQVELVGSLAEDPVTTTLPDGVLQVRYTLDIERRYKNSDGKYDHDDVDCISYGLMAQRIAKKLKKGMSIGIVGRIQTIQQPLNGDGTEQGRAFEVVAVEISYMEAPGEMRN